MTWAEASRERLRAPWRKSAGVGNPQYSAAVGYPENVLAQELARFPKAELVWCQEEPQNQGAWTFVRDRIADTVAKLGGK